MSALERAKRVAAEAINMLTDDQLTELRQRLDSAEESENLEEAGESAASVREREEQ